MILGYGLEKATLRGGFIIDRKGVVVDTVNHRTVDKVEIDGIDYIDFDREFLRFKHNVGSKARVVDLLGYAFFRPKVRVDELQSLQCLPIDGDYKNIELTNLIWKYPVGGLESKDYPGFFYVPGYSGYVVKLEGEELKLLYTASNHFKKWHVGDTGYLVASLHNDEHARMEGVSLQRIAGLTFLDYPLNARDMIVDHKDHDRTNNRISNFQWMTSGDNIRKGMENATSLIKGEKKDAVSMSHNRLRKLGGKLHYLDAQTNDIVLIDDVNEVLNKLNLADWQISQSIIAGEKGKLGMVQGRYIFRRLEDPLPDVTNEDLKNNLSFGGQPRPTLLKNRESGEVREFPSAAELVRNMAFSKKVVTTRLKREDQVIPDTVFLVKYKDDTSPWIE